MNPVLLLASASPRRRALLAQLGLQCVQLAPDLDETPSPAEPPAAYVARLARAKAQAVRARVNTTLPILAADTAVVLGERLLGKPRDAAEAAAMWQALGGRWHQVLTAVTLLDRTERHVVVTTAVRLRRITPAEAAAYWASGEPRDTAGGYAIQGLGAMFVAGLRGSYSNVVGLPLYETAALLRAAGIDPLARPQPE